MLLFLEFGRTPPLQCVLFPDASVDRGVVLPAALLGVDLLGGRVVDGPHPPHMVDDSEIPTHPDGPGHREPRPGAERTLRGYLPQQRLLRVRAPGDGVAAGDGAGCLLQLTDQQPRHVTVPARHEPCGIDDLPRQLDSHRELEGVVVAGQAELLAHAMDAHVDLVHRGVTLRGRPGPGGADRWEIGVVAAVRGREDQGVIDAGERPAGESEAGQLPDRDHRVGQPRSAVGLLVPFRWSAEVGHEALSCGWG
ncbi:hypothetical protein OG887_24565 [Streptomyces sp. NBC_00053]